MPESRPGGTEAARPEHGGHPNNAKNEQDPLIGQVIGGRFRIVSVIARGGMGKVYRAEQSPLGRICALKVLSPKYEGDRDPEFHKRFFLEASTASKLTHPNTVTVFDYGQSDDLYYIAMEYIEGRTLHRVLREEGPLAEARVIFIASQVCRSLREAHMLGVVHRDLKPGNILLSDRGDERDNVKVLDFGLVKDVTGEKEDLTQAGLFMGSPKYMAPEQILGGEITARTDIYSLGVMMFEMTTGKVPFDRGASVGTLMAHVNDVPPPLREIYPEVHVSEAMEALIFRCLDKDPARRFASMKDLLTGLKRVEGGDFVMTETQENGPAARFDSSSGAVTNRGGEGPATMTGSISLGSMPPPTDTKMSQSISSPAVGAPSESGALRLDASQKSRAPVWIGVAAVAMGIALAAVIVSRTNTAEVRAGADGSGSSTPSSSSAPVASVAAAGVVASSTPSASANAAAPTSAAPAVRVVRVDSDPAGAAVAEAGVQVCTTTPCQVTYTGEQAKAEHKLVLAKKGYKQVELTVGTADEKAAAHMELIPAAAQVKAAPATTVIPGAKPNPYGD